MQRKKNKGRANCLNLGGVGGVEWEERRCVWGRKEGEGVVGLVVVGVVRVGVVVLLLCCC